MGVGLALLTAAPIVISGAKALYDWWKGSSKKQRKKMGMAGIRSTMTPEGAYMQFDKLEPKMQKQFVDVADNWAKENPGLMPKLEELVGQGEAAFPDIANLMVSEDTKLKDVDYTAEEQRMREGFAGKTLPEIMERFTGMGGQTGGSSALEGRMAGAGAQLESDIGLMRERGQREFNLQKSQNEIMRDKLKGMFAELKMKPAQLGLKRAGMGQTGVQNLIKLLSPKGEMFQGATGTSSTLGADIAEGLPKIIQAWGA